MMKFTIEELKKSWLRYCLITIESCFDVVAVPIRSEMYSLFVNVEKDNSLTDIACPWARFQNGDDDFRRRST